MVVNDYQVEDVGEGSIESESSGDEIVNPPKIHTDKAAITMHTVGKAVSESEGKSPTGKRASETQIDDTITKKSKITLEQPKTTAHQGQRSIHNMVLQGLSFFTGLVVHPLTHHQHDTSNHIISPRKE